MVTGLPFLPPYCASASRYSEWLARLILREEAPQPRPLAGKELTRTLIRKKGADNDFKGDGSDLLTLSVPVEGGNRRLRSIHRLPADVDSLDDIALSEHGNWRHVHTAALVTAYSSEPFFIHFADPLLDAIRSSRTLGEFLLGCHRCAIAPFTDADLAALGNLLRENPARAYALADERRKLVNPDAAFIDALFRLGKEAIFSLLPTLNNNKQ